MLSLIRNSRSVATVLFCLATVASVAVLLVVDRSAELTPIIDRKPTPPTGLPLMPSNGDPIFEVATSSKHMGSPHGNFLIADPPLYGLRLHGHGHSFRSPMAFT